ncbi:MULTISPECIES: GNAT family N-acetyltransferase [Chryseobacterium]|uniref:Anhydro-N-acetylmuramic acid kinase n=1 Tax=Chryseobacterium balustinum TaxID=246 RepID=A0AAX2IRZ1_9FLAO|nr:MULTISPECIES: GNAT family N-acetyltransferase [Chryseobacterium]AZB28192.1 N-acetyltransferase [Chryseobacterium balustinum]REC39860.1 N-acetyltransferase [Chryseobacterium sp. 5_R23647]SKC11594.1 Protein N-acetyltransferase, RimJ/RimL family [Chryseobacterium balustinum]SQA92386.1 anhydro-N-acetylmuramic acid kinase [Chryseobacterium balustinum]
MKYLLTNQQTKKLLFRKLENSDFENWLKLFEDEQTAKMLGMDNFETPKERCEKWFEWTFHRYENNLGGQNVLISKENNQLVGQCGLLVREVENEFELEIAYSILPQFRGKGFAIEAAKKCRDFAFESEFHDRLVSIIIPENENSKNVALKNGMSFKKQIDYSRKKMDLFQVTKQYWENLD